MCILLFSFRETPFGYRLALAHNLDEFMDAPCSPLARHPQIDGHTVLAGSYASAAESRPWLAVASSGRFAAALAIREVGAPATCTPEPFAHLVREFMLSSLSIEQYAAAMKPSAALPGFNLIIGDGHHVAYISNRYYCGAVRLAPGPYVISNRVLDAPWAKCEVGRLQFEASIGQWLEFARPDPATLDCMISLLGDTSRPPAPAGGHATSEAAAGLQDWDFATSSIFMTATPVEVGGPPRVFGTRSSVAALVDAAERSLSVTEICWASDVRAWQRRECVVQSDAGVNVLAQARAGSMSALDHFSASMAPVLRRVYPAYNKMNMKRKIDKAIRDKWDRLTEDERAVYERRAEEDRELLNVTRQQRADRELRRTKAGRGGAETSTGGGASAGGGGGNGHESDSYPGDSGDSGYSHGHGRRRASGGATAAAAAAAAAGAGGGGGGGGGRPAHDTAGGGGAGLFMQQQLAQQQFAYVDVAGAAAAAGGGGGGDHDSDHVASGAAKRRRTVSAAAAAAAAVVEEEDAAGGDV